MDDDNEDDKVYEELCDFLGYRLKESFVDVRVWFSDGLFVEKKNLKSKFCLLVEKIFVKCFWCKKKFWSL